MCFVKRSTTIIKSAPNKKPNVTGIIASESQKTLEYSKDGTSKDQNDAENIMPEAKLIVNRFSFLDSFLKKKINRAPTVVDKHGKVNDKAIAT